MMSNKAVEIAPGETKKFVDSFGKTLEITNNDKDKTVYVSQPDLEVYVDSGEVEVTVSEY